MKKLLFLCLIVFSLSTTQSPAIIALMIVVQLFEQHTQEWLRTDGTGM